MNLTQVLKLSHKCCGIFTLKLNAAVKLYTIFFTSYYVFTGKYIEGGTSAQLLIVSLDLISLLCCFEILQHFVLFVVRAP
jgi:hypothetical protein